MGLILKLLGLTLVLSGLNLARRLRILKRYPAAKKNIADSVRYRSPHKKNMLYH